VPSIAFFSGIKVVLMTGERKTRFMMLVLCNPEL
jgi:hypothetical protein